jgi:hypothetical protein
MATKKVVKKETMSVSIELPAVTNYTHFVTIKEKAIDFICGGNNKWISISKIEDLANDFNFCPYCGTKIDGLGLHKSVSKLIQPNERYKV